MPYQIVTRDNPPAIPASVAQCPICGAVVEIEDIDEWTNDESGEFPTESGLHINCTTAPDPDKVSKKQFYGWYDYHWSMPYDDWLPTESKVYKWLTANYRFTESESTTRQKLAAWNAGLPRKVDR